MGEVAGVTDEQIKNLEQAVREAEEKFARDAANEPMPPRGAWSMNTWNDPLPTREEVEELKAAQAAASFLDLACATVNANADALRMFRKIGAKKNGSWSAYTDADGEVQPERRTREVGPR